MLGDQIYDRDLSREGEVAGLRFGDRVRYSDECFPPLRGQEATVRGFDAAGQIVTQPDGQDGYATTRPHYAARHLIKQ